MDSAAPTASLAAALTSAGAPFAPANALTSRREMFCRVYVACGNAAEAARQAGYAQDGARQQGHRLLADDTITQRIQELWADAEAARSADRDLLIDKTEQLYDAAMAAKSFNAAARALGLQARLAGFTGPARDREEVVPGRPGPVARAAARKAAQEQEQEARQGERETGADDGGERPESGSPATGPHPRPSPPRGEGSPDRSCDRTQPAMATLEADATRFPSPLGGEGPGVRACPNPRDSRQNAPTQTPAAHAPCRQPGAASLPAPDPWAEAARIERERKLAGVHSTLSGLRRRECLASEAALAARDAAEAADAEAA